MINNFHRGRAIRNYSVGVCASLGQWKAPYQTDIEQIVRNFPKCFNSRDVLPLISKSEDFAHTASTGGLRKYITAGNTYESLENDMNAAYWKLDYWKSRLETEPNVQYCVDTTGGIKSNDRYQIIQAITGPYQVASAVVGANSVIDDSLSQLKKDLSTPSNWVPNFLNEAPWWVKAGGITLVGLAGYAIFQRFKEHKASASVKTEPKTEVAKPAPSVTTPNEGTGK